MRLFYLFAFCITVFVARAQQSTFDADNDNWGAEGDPLGTMAGWASMGGLPGGHIRVTDAATGGIWYFTAPAKFRGNKCGAYDRWFRYDQFTSDTMNQIFSTDPGDLEIWGDNNLKLVFDNTNNPGLNWTHYDVHLREDAGWRIGSSNGPVPTEAEFRSVLSNITKIRIKGEYRPAADFGGLDNVILENNFQFDLDDDDSSGAGGNDFRSDTLCTAEATVTDADIVFVSELPIDSVVVRVLGADSDDLLASGALPPQISVAPTSTPGYLVFVNNGNASTADFIAALLTVVYLDLSSTPERGERLLGINAFTECGDMGIRFVYLPIFPPPDAGLDADTIVCAASGPLQLFQVLNGNPEAGGFWSPRPEGGPSLFDPAKDAPGVYQYIIPPAGECPGDTAAVEISVEFPPALRADTTACYTDTLVLSVPGGLVSWQWSDGSHQRDRIVSFSGVYTLTGATENCVFTDSVQIGFYTCEPCAWYAPNVFSPNDDGHNDGWHIFLPCLWQTFRLEIFDRWGSLVFAADDPETEWDGYNKSGAPVPGVYIWRIEWVGELFGIPHIYRAAGDVTVVR
ncbi:MAG TPA: gliding motility-associated C-terminal domain-containing protein [Saprospiraceae bacterium]|nr:gliding motility-associated C-terminal domain-containing protein [Saprospiraceae bacterium]HPI08240.1 gliding motility-associated C-terminal domain-containing protein [Saprospiraceae bacterium]